MMNWVGNLWGVKNIFFRKIKNYSKNIFRKSNEHEKYSKIKKWKDNLKNNLDYFVDFQMINHYSLKQCPNVYYYLKYPKWDIFY